MEKQKSISELQENDILTNTLFLVQKKTLAVSRTNKPYLSITISDKTGLLEARVWERADYFNTLFENNDYVKLSGTVVSFQGILQLNTKFIEKVDDSQINPADFLPSSEYDESDMRRSLFEYIDSIENINIKKLLRFIFTNKKLSESYFNAPAGKSIHHAFIHGLMEHSLSVASLCDNMLQNYQQLAIPIDRDLIIAGALLHDIGKIYELDFQKSFQYTTEGQLVGHVVLGYQIMVDASYQIVDFPYKLRAHLGHLILSHQGKLEFGSPKTPMTIEAFILHTADELDSKINMLVSNIPHKEQGTRRVWSDYLKSIENYAANTYLDLNTVKDSDIPERRRYILDFDDLNS
ncbi:HD domain-containing protein [bacterium]|nr:HD domain-containing protein [bacterium]